MNDLAPSAAEAPDRLTGLGDDDLIARVRAGDTAAYGELFSRHVGSATRLARQIAGPDVDDLVSEAFTKVLATLRRGGGPEVAFRAYLLTAVRRLHVDRIRASARTHLCDDLTPFDRGTPFRDTAVAGFDTGAAAKAFASLPERWQLVLWHLEVEGEKPADVAPLLGMSPNSVSALAYRAREGLRQAFLTMHLSAAENEACRWATARLGAHVRRALSRRDCLTLEEHLDGCRRCTALRLEVDQVNSELRGILAPLVLGTAAGGYLAGANGCVTATTGVAFLLGRLRDAVAIPSGATGAGVAAAGVAIVAAVAVVAVGVDDSALGRLDQAPLPNAASRLDGATGGPMVSRGTAPPQARGNLTNERLRTDSTVLGRFGLGGVTAGLGVAPSADATGARSKPLGRAPGASSGPGGKTSSPGVSSAGAGTVLGEADGTSDPSQPSEPPSEPAAAPGTNPGPKPGPGGSPAPGTGSGSVGSPPPGTGTGPSTPPGRSHAGKSKGKGIGGGRGGGRGHTTTPAPPRASHPAHGSKAGHHPAPATAHPAPVGTDTHSAPGKPKKGKG